MPLPPNALPWNLSPPQFSCFPLGLLLHQTALVSPTTTLLTRPRFTQKNAGFAQQVLAGVSPCAISLPAQHSQREPVHMCCAQTVTSNQFVTAPHFHCPSVLHLSQHRQLWGRRAWEGAGKVTKTPRSAPAVERRELSGVLLLRPARLLSASRRAACRVGHGFPRDLLSSTADPHTWLGARGRERRGRQHFSQGNRGKQAQGSEAAVPSALASSGPCCSASAMCWSFAERIRHSSKVTPRAQCKPSP